VTVSFEVVEDPARGCAALMVGAVIGGGHIVLTGGSTPRAAYQHFVEAVGTVGIDLSRTHLWMGDERCVDPDDDRANYAMIKESLLDPLGAGNQPIMHRMKGELGPDRGADDYQRELAQYGPPVPPKFDLVLLGIGPDGHCASLFPNQDTLMERARMVVAVPMAGLEPFIPRITMTLPTLATGRHIVFLATGAAKADAIAAAFGPGADPDPATPASLLAPKAELITVLADDAAAAHVRAGDPR
jgi:6-phosphogluconolactonase